MSAVMSKRFRPGIDDPKVLIIKVKRGGGSKNNNSGPSGYQMTPARRNARAWAEMAGGFGMINGFKRKDYLDRQERRRKELGQDTRTGGPK